MNKKFCEECLKDTDCQEVEQMVCEIVNHQEIEYTKKYFLCSVCQSEVYDEAALTETLKNYNKASRVATGMIKIEEIEQLLEKYQIGKKPLASLLGWGETTIIRYLSGNNIEKLHSERLKELLENPREMLLLLNKNKDKITDMAYRKCLAKIQQENMLNQNSNLLRVSNYIIRQVEDITNMALQKLLYFVEGIWFIEHDISLYENSPVAWEHGPVYRDIYYCYLDSKSAALNVMEEIDTPTLEEKQVIDFVLSVFGNYSGISLKKMSHETFPWQVKYPQNACIEWKLMKSYFRDVDKEYRLLTKRGLKKYCNTLQNKKNMI